ncbi:MAG: hypothetical protein ISS19_10515 [Bacteroidales bacterium]|nr:hypothetical protein [Bacteroidales bacterium]
MILLIIISALALFLLWLLFAPLIIRVDSDNQRYSLSVPGIFKAMVVPDDKLFHIRLWVLFIPFKIDPMRRRMKKGEEQGRNKRKKRRRDFSKLMKARLMALKELIRSFTLKKLWLNLDTDDFILNSHLVPVFTTINNQDVNLTVNYEGEISLFMVLNNRIASLLWIGMKYIYRTKY